MRLSDIKGERTFDVVADIIDAVAVMAQDEKVLELFRPKPCPEDMDKRDFAVKRITGSVPGLLRDHKAELVRIFSTLNDQTPESYVEGLTLKTLIEDLTELITDRAFADFLS